MELFSHSDDITIPGQDTNPCRYARAAVDDQPGEDAPSEVDTLGSQQVFQFPSSNNICWEKEKMSTCYTLACRNNKTKPAIVVKSSNQRYKTEMLRQSKKS